MDFFEASFLSESGGSLGDASLNEEAELLHPAPAINARSIAVENNIASDAGNRQWNFEDPTDGARNTTLIRQV
jgi:hypothetical protein